MAPRIKNISADEFRRLFQAPEIASPGLTVSDAINLQNALEARRSNQLKERQNIAAIERRIADEDAKKRDRETASLERGTAAAKEAEEVAREGIDPTQPGPEVGPFTAEDQAVIEQAQATAQAKFRTQGPAAVLKAESTEEQSVRAADRRLADEVALLEEKGRQDRLTLSAKDKAAQKKSKGKLSALGQSKIFEAEGFQGLVNELTAGEKTIPDSKLQRAIILADAKFGGNISATLRSMGLPAPPDDAINFQQQRSALSVRIYKTLSGDVGNIAASESARALPLIPSAFDSKSLRKRKIAALDRAVKRAKSALQVLINDPNSASLSEKELRARRVTIADQAVMEALIGFEAGNPETGSEFETPAEANEAALQSGFEILSVEDE